MNSSRGNVRLIIGSVLIVLGGLLLLSNTDVINLDWGWDFIRTWWPIILIAWGLWELVSGGFRFRMWPVVLLLLGIGFQLSALDLWEWDFSVVWPVFIVIVGLAILLRRRGRRERHRRRASGLVVDGVVEGTTVSHPGSVAGSGSGSYSGNGGSWRAVFNNLEEDYTGREFRGGEVEANFGNVVLDLRGATLPDEGARLDVNLTFGGLHLRVPEGWRIDYESVSAHFAQVQDNRDQQAPEVVTGQVTVSGTATFGNLEISG